LFSASSAGLNAQLKGKCQDESVVDSGDAVRSWGCKPTFEAKRAPHPGLRANGFHPVGERWYKSKVFSDVLFTDPPDGDYPARGEGDGQTEDGFGHEDTLGVVTQGAVSKIGDDLFDSSNQSWMRW